VTGYADPVLDRCNPPLRRFAGLIACIAALSFAAAAGAQAQLYRWVDEKGVTHFSDRPMPGAERVDVPAAQGFTPPPAVRTVPSAASTAGGNAASRFTYTRIEIASPANDQAFINTGGEIQVAAVLDPALGSGHRTWFVLDGQRLQDLSPEATSALLRVDRGSHTLAFQVADESGALVASSSPVTFHVRQNSIAEPPRGPLLNRPPATPTPLPAPRPRP